MLNPAQQTAYEAILQGRSIFLTGSGGTGKSYLIGEVYTAIHATTTRALSLTAMTGCAALLLHPRARTLHSWAGIGLGDAPAHVLVETVRVNKRAAMRWRVADILVIDEVSMLTPELFEKLDAVGRAIRRRNCPFGGIQLVFVGDFYQLPPVSVGETRFVFESPLWKALGLEVHELTEIVRQRDPVFQTILGEARRGRLRPESIQILQSRIGLDYSGLQIQPSMVFTRRAKVHDINRKHLDELLARSPAKDTHTYKAVTLASMKAVGDPGIPKAVEKLDKVASYVPELTLAVGAQVMLLMNDLESGLTNGSRGVVVGFERDKEPEETDPDLLIPLVKFCGGRVFPIKRHKWDTELEGISRTQLPLTLAYAVTIHKTQGSTLDCALIDVGERTFEYGQAYVALSRVKSLEALYIHDFHPGAFKAHPKVKEFYSQLTVQAPAPAVEY
jgi:ATP-dependent DNA helicase PIF1